MLQFMIRDFGTSIAPFDPLLMCERGRQIVVHLFIVDRRCLRLSPWRRPAQNLCVQFGAVRDLDRGHVFLDHQDAGIHQRAKGDIEFQIAC